MQTSGKNLFDAEKTRVLENWQTNDMFPVYLEKAIYVGSGKKVTISRDASLPLGIDIGVVVALSKNTDTVGWIYNKDNKYDAQLTVTSTEDYIYIRCSKSKATVMVDLIPKIQIEISDKATPYEPYTGGKPSPSPEYPQEIVNVGKWNEGTQKYEVDVKVTGKNILNLQESDTVFDRCVLQEDGSVRSDIKNYYFSTIKLSRKFAKNIKNGDTITFRVDNFIRNKISLLVGIIDNDNRQTVIERNQEGNEVSIPIQGAKEVCSIEIRLNRKSAPHTDTTSVFKNLIVCFGDDSVYQPYKSQTLTLTSDRPITKWDKLVEQDGQIGWLYGSKTYTFVGTESFNGGGESYHSGFSTNMYCDIPTSINTEGYMHRLIYVNGLWGATDKEGHCFNGNNQHHIRISNIRLGISDDATPQEKYNAFREHIRSEYNKGTPYELLYNSSETTFVPLPKSEQDAIRALKTYYPTTVITADGGEIVPTVEVTYTADTKNYIDNKLKAINAALVNTQKALL